MSAAFAMTKANAVRRLVHRHACGHNLVATISAPLNSVSAGRFALCNHDGGRDCNVMETSPQAVIRTIRINQESRTGCTYRNRRRRVRSVLPIPE